MHHLEVFPDLPEGAPVLLIALTLVGWLAARIQLVRRQAARHAEGGSPPTTWPWLQRLAMRRWILPALGVLALALAAAVAATFVAAR